MPLRGGVLWSSLLAPAAACVLLVVIVACAASSVTAYRPRDLVTDPTGPSLAVSRIARLRMANAAAAASGSGLQEQQPQELIGNPDPTSNGHICTQSLDESVTLTTPGKGDLPHVDAAGVAKHLLNRTFADPYFHYFACIDEREQRPIFGTPGGDFAEYLLALNAFAKAGGAVNTYEEVQSLFFMYVDTLPVSRKFYLHTDDHAEADLVAAVEKRLNMTTRFPIRNITSPTPEQAEVLRELVVKPEFNGCGHVKLMLKYPATYGLRPNLTIWTLQSYFAYLWAKDQDGEKLAYLQNIHIGPHYASGIVNLISDRYTSALCEGQPLIVPRQGSRALFLYSSVAVQILRTHMATFFAYLLGIDPVGLVKTMNDLAALGVDTTIGYLAPDLPLYTATLKPTPAPEDKHDEWKQEWFFPLAGVAGGSLLLLFGCTLYVCCCRRRGGGGGSVQHSIHNTHSSGSSGSGCCGGCLASCCARCRRNNSTEGLLMDDDLLMHDADEMGGLGARRTTWGGTPINSEL